MIKFNENHIVGNFIKQLLATFNLPKYENGQYLGVDENYAWGNKLLNKTKNLVIRNNIYDSYTHEYLGDYLRFLKFYKGLDLMSLYNCFSNNVCSSFHYTNSALSIKFDTQDIAYKMYMVPVKLGAKYTIALDSSLPVELCVSAYGKYQSENSNNSDLINYTYRKIEHINFGSPAVYDALALLEDSSDTSHAASARDFAHAAETTLKLIIKLPKNCVSSIVVLEGEFTNCNDATIQFTGTRLDRNSNHTVINFGEEENEHGETIKCAELPVPLSTPLQLLYLNTGVSHPFADRLIEYLTGMAITPDDELSDNITRVQKTMELNGYTFWTEGVWEEVMRKELYTYMTETSDDWDSLDTYGINHDILGYVDKDTEKFYKGQAQDKFGNKITENGRPVYVTLANIDIYPDIYKDAKVKEGK